MVAIEGAAQFLRSSKPTSSIALLQGAAAVTIASNTVALFKVAGDIFAIEGRCIRCGTCLADGFPQGRIVA